MIVLLYRYAMHKDIFQIIYDNTCVYYVHQ